jgi:hypothetical protein
LTEPETNQAAPRLAHNFAAPQTILGTENDPGPRKTKLVHNGFDELFPVNIAFVGSAAQPIPPKSPRPMKNSAQRPMVTNYPIVTIVTTELDFQHIILLLYRHMAIKSKPTPQRP